MKVNVSDMPAGRPKKWTDPQTLELKGLKWIDEQLAEGKPLTISGLALALDTNRETLMNYENDGEFFDTVKKLKGFCERYAEERMLTSSNQAGGIFALKNYGWRDKQEIDHTTAGQSLSPYGQISDEAKEAMRLIYEEDMRKRALK